MWAYVYVLKTKELLYVSVDKLLNFSLDSYDEIENSYEKKVFFWQNEANKSPVPVYVLLISSSLPLLKTQVSNKRPVLPKIHYSDINAKYEPPEVNKYVKKKPKEINVIKARKEKESEIIKAHENSEKQKVEDNKENVSNDKNNKSDSDQLFKSTCNSKLMDIISAINDDETIKKVKCLFTDYEICLAERDELKKKLYEAQEMTKILTDTCDNLKETNVKKGTSQKLDAILDLLKQIADYIYSGTSRDENYKQDTPKNNKDEQITCDIPDIDIPKAVYNNIMREKEPRSFITNMSYAVWGPEVLASRCVRSQSNVVEPELTPTKKFAVINEFEKWMRIKRKMPEMLIDEQLDRSKVNKYFTGSIIAARRKTNYKMKETFSKNKTVQSKRAETTKAKSNNEKHKLDSRIKKFKATKEEEEEEGEEEKEEEEEEASDETSYKTDDETSDKKSTEQYMTDSDDEKSQ